MATGTLPFRLKSYQTALAIVVPSQLHAEINSLRKIHDKAYERWDPHINVLYPFVDPDQLGDAINALRQAIEEKDIRSFELQLAGPDKFVQRRGATVHLKPNPESEEKTSRLRESLVHALGRDAKEGTHDGLFRGHMTIGQAGLLGPTLGILVDKVAKLAPLEWQCQSLTVLKREPSGKMVPVDEIWLQGDEKKEPGQNEVDPTAAQNWRLCNSFSPSGGWQQLSKNTILERARDLLQTKITVSTYNLMADSQAPAFASRLTSVVNAIASVTKEPSCPHILCLQEVSEEMLEILLSNPIICGLYLYSTHRPSSLLSSDRNLVTMASVPFTYNVIQFVERHKSALAIDLIGIPTKVVNTHLSAGLSDGAVAAKKRQIDLLTDFSHHHESTGEVIITGDFNLTSASRTLETALAENMISSATAQLVRTAIDPDIWEDAFLSTEKTTPDNSIDEEAGATFDRRSNPLAALSISPIDDCPQRYDRVLYRRDGTLKTEGVQLFGLPDENGECGSDHYGFSASLTVDEVQSTSTQALSPPTKSTAERIVVAQDSMDLEQLLQPLLPSEGDREQRRKAIQLVHEALSLENSLSDVILAPLGSYLLETYFPDSDVDLLAIGSTTPQVFFELATSKLRDLEVGTDDGVKGVHLVNSLVSIAEMCIMGIKFDLQYCHAPMLLERYHAENGKSPLHELAFDKALVSSLPPSSLRPFNTYRDTAYILNTILDIDSYRMAHRFLSAFLRNRGLYSAKFGYLGGIHLSLMLNRVVKLINNQFLQSSSTDSPKLSPSAIVSTFFNYYANFDWAASTVSDPNLTEQQQPARSSRDAVFIPAIHIPTARPNVASSCTSLSAKTLAEEFRAASKKLSRDGWDWCLHPNIGVQDFLNGFPAYISLSLDIWSVSEIGGAKVREIIGALESKFPRLMLTMGRLSGMYARTWPARFQSREEVAQEIDTTQYKGLYLIGVRMTNEHADGDAKKILRGKVIGAVGDFENGVKASREFEGGNCWLNAEYLPAKKIKSLDLIIDDRDWSGEKAGATTDIDGDDQHLENIRPRNFNVHPQAQQSSRPNTTPLRMAHDIINRIKHDTDHFSADEFLIGYEDRFEEKPKEVDLLKWKLEQTDEEFIPLHRVVHIRRKDEKGGEVVWDRKQKLDLIFGSGKRILSV